MQYIDSPNDRCAVGRDSHAPPSHAYINEGNLVKLYWIGQSPYKFTGIYAPEKIIEHHVSIVVCEGHKHCFEHQWLSAEDIYAYAAAS